MRTSLKKLLDILLSTMNKNPMMKSNKLTVFRNHFKDIMNAITVLEEDSLFSNFGADFMKALNDVNHAFDLDCLSSKKQSTIKYFFQTF